MSRRQWLAALLLALVAVFVRVCNIGTFSLWLDEVFTMNVASQPLLETLSACAEDAENVPVYAVVANLGLRAGLTDPWIRLLPIAAGLASIVLLAVWTKRWFGATAAWLVAAFCAVAPFHVRYSQELRAYPYLLLMCTATLVLTDRLRSHPGWRSTTALAGVIALGFYTNLTYALVLVPAAGMVVVGPSPEGGELRATRKPSIARFVTAVFLGALAFAPWIWLISQNLITRIARTRTTDWTLIAVGQRWECLTVAPGHFNLLSWLGAFLAFVFVVGVVTATRKPAGRSVLLPALVTLVAWEVLLVLVQHWSAPRYDTALWPFVAVLLALGFEQVLRLLRWRPLGWMIVTVVVVLMLIRVDAYHRFGRPHWDRLAQAVREVRRPGEQIVTIDHWAMRCLSYYLGEPVATVADKPHRLRTFLEASPSLLVVSRGPLRPKFLNRPEAFAEVTRIPQTAGLYRLRRRPDSPVTKASNGDNGPPASWPEPVDQPVPKSLERETDGCLSRLFDRSGPPEVRIRTRLELDPADSSHLRAGWGRSAQRAGATSTWVHGPEASVDLGPAEAVPHDLSIHLSPVPDLQGTQWVRVLLNGHSIGEDPLRSEGGTFSYDAPANLWNPDRNLLVLQFSRAKQVDGKGPTVAAAVDWIEWTPRAKTASG